MAMGLHTSSRSGRNSRRAPMAEINVTPLVDVMLVLLIIFMVTAPLLTAGVPVELPESRANPLTNEQQSLVLSMDATGGIYLDDEQLGPGELPDRLVAITPDGSGRLPDITLRADRTLPYGNVMAVMGELNRAGFNSISLVTSGSVTPP
ncbi:ExbD/TolR family protein [Qipengyuania atrilutea]|uniref:ExbD/TolR family protein n=1 Tax=Qipengyuania atrilutea TaxID=2744473 RepID=A0A850H5L3_9SPHN|nr:ExbD/TolR family protein [Actirhodobacter atriluteus]NVD45787.1 ExbD/TolR family protein [Actirhodobacter atriluteus]